MYVCVYVCCKFSTPLLGDLKGNMK